jgi:hypothetical protein
MAFLTDSSTNNFQLTAFGNTALNTTFFKFGSGSASFDGNGDYIRGNQLFDYSSNFTIEGWVYRTGGGSIGTIFEAGNIGPGQGGVHFYIDGAGTFVLNDGFSPDFQGGTATLNQWVHFAIVRNNNVNTLYINGISVGSGTQTYPVTNNIFTIGGAPNYGFYFQGYLDDFRVTSGIARYTANFTSPTQQLFDPSDPYINNVSLLLHMDNLSGSQVFVDSSTNNFSLTGYGNTAINQTTKKFGNGAVYFDGTGDYLKTNWNSAFTFGAGDFTVEFWAYPTGTPNGIGFITAEYNPGSIGNVAWAFGAASSLGAGSGSELFFGSYEGSWTGVQSVSSLALSAWSHVAASRSSGTLRLFLNGTNIAQGTFTNNIQTGDPLIIGRRWDYNEASKFFNGYIDELRITKGVARYTANFVPQTAPFANM